MDNPKLHSRAEITDGTHKINLIIPTNCSGKLSNLPKVGDIVSFVKYKSQVVSNKETLLLLSDLEIVYDDAIFDEANAILDINVAKAQGSKLNAAYEHQTLIKFKPKEDEYDIGSLEFSDRKEEPYRKDSSIDDFTPISSISTLNNDWVIKARVTKIYPLRTYKNDRGEGKIQNIELMDAFGGMIEATMFNVDVDKFMPIIQEGKVY